ncbi:MAG: hydrogenase maturation protease [Actinobacteria bacterium]|nr:hydrogenase maturation protease [Actinomycetota bacterium]
MLVAGIGNVFMGDDGFGVEVAAQLAERELPDGVDVADFGIRGMDLAYALVDGYEAALLVDACPRGQAPGTLEVIEPDVDPHAFVGFEAHGLDPVGVLHFAQQFGPLPPRTFVVGCEPLRMSDPDDGKLDGELSPPVRAAIEPAVDLIVSLIDELLKGARTP